MRIKLLTILIALVVSLIVDGYLYFVLLAASKRKGKGKKARKGGIHVGKWVPTAQLWTSIALYVILIATLFLPHRTGSNTVLALKMWILYGYCTILVSKAIFVLLDMIARIPLFFHKRRRWRWLSYTGVSIAVVAFILMWWGALINRFNLQVRTLDVVVPELPASFDGLRIVQISDIHSGTFIDDPSFLAEMVDTINALKPDVVFFTGDIVNREHSELAPFITTLAGLKAPMGVYSILGNHDYGDYIDWPTPQDKVANMQALRADFGKMGWKLLLNETAWLRKGNDSIAVIGVENVGDPPFPTYGDLYQAYPTVSDSVTKILLTHNPAHWVDDICDNDNINIDLTLSGHTHAMQMELFGLSPGVFRYPTWGGLYQDKSGRHKLYVNIGVGTVGMPARIGANPEVTLITLHRK